MTVVPLSCSSTYNTAFAAWVFVVLPVFYSRKYWGAAKKDAPVCLFHCITLAMGRFKRLQTGRRRGNTVDGEAEVWLS